MSRLTELSQRADAEVDVIYKGEKMKVEVKTISHRAFLESIRVNAEIGQLYDVERDDDGQVLSVKPAYSGDSASEVIKLVKDHILRVDGEDFQSLPHRVQDEFVEGITPGDFWDVYHKIQERQGLKESEKKS